jgi:glycosyltransferase involved in cell wall biosynthesis
VRVLRVLYVLRPSGVEANLRASAELWRANGIDIDILATGPSEGPFAPALRAVGYHIAHLPQEPVAQFAPRYLSLLRRNRYDLVHVQAEQGNIATVGLARLGAPRVIRSCHNSFQFTGALRLERTVQRGLLRRLGVAHVSVSPSVARSEWLRFRNPTIRVPNAFDDRRFRPPSDAERMAARAAVGLDAADFALVSVGNCSRIKNHAAVIEALPALLASGVPVVYLHVGAEEDGHPERQMAERLGVSAHVRFLGQRSDVDRVLHAADCYVMPSLQEGLSNAALEALASGVPVALADVPGLRDLRDQVPGIVWMAPDSAGVERAIAEVRALPPTERARCAQERAARTHAQFAMETHVRSYVELYRGGVGVPS